MAIQKYKSRQIKKLLKINEKELEDYYRWYLNEITFDDLTPIQKEKLERYRKIWSYYAMGRTKEMILSAIKKEYDIETRQAEYDIASSIQLHGSLDQVDKDGRRVASREFFDMLSQLALKDKQYQVAVQARREADILSEIHKEELEGHDPTKFTRAAKVVYNVTVVNANGDTSITETQTLVLDE